MTNSSDEDPSDRPARILFIRNRGLTFSAVGTLDPQVSDHSDDDCQASCVDWYGNARPVFVDRRVFALIGYEMVEGRFAGRRIETVRRLNFMPPTADIP